MKSKGMDLINWMDCLGMVHKLSEMCVCINIHISRHWKNDDGLLGCTGKCRMWLWHKLYGIEMDNTLVSTRIELIFWHSGTMLCFTFSLRIILITLWFLAVANSVYPKSRSFQFPILCQGVSAQKNCEGAWPGIFQGWPKGYSRLHNVMLSV